MRVHLVSWDPVDARAHLRALDTLGHTATWLEGTTGTPLMRALRASDADLFLIDLGRRPSHGREVAMALRSSPATRQRPLVFAGGDEVATASMRDLLPDGTFTTWGRLKTALPKALKAAPAVPVVPPDRLFSGRTLAQKLGIAAGERLAAVGAPPAFADLLGPLTPREILILALASSIGEELLFRGALLPWFASVAVFESHAPVAVWTDLRHYSSVMAQSIGMGVSTGMDAPRAAEIRLLHGDGLEMLTEQALPQNSHLTIHTADGRLVSSQTSRCGRCCHTDPPGPTPPQPRAVPGACVPGWRAHGAPWRGGTVAFRPCARVWLLM